MSQSGFSGALAADLAVDVQLPSATSRRLGKRARDEELELREAERALMQAVSPLDVAAVTRIEGTQLHTECGRRGLQCTLSDADA